MTKYEQVSAALDALPATRREEIAEIIDTLFHADLHPERTLSDEQLAALQRRVANPGSVATDEEVEAFFARFNA